MIKNYVLDTNVLIHAPYAMECFEDNNVIIPLVVIEELDGLKKSEDDKGASAREAIRNLERYRMQGDLFQGIQLEKGTKVIILGDPNQIDNSFADERTNGLSYASEYMKGSPYCYQITLNAEECERSDLAMDAIQRLQEK